LATSSILLLSSPPFLSPSSSLSQSPPQSSSLLSKSPQSPSSSLSSLPLPSLSSLSFHYFTCVSFMIGVSVNVGEERSKEVGMTDCNNVCELDRLPDNDKSNDCDC